MATSDSTTLTDRQRYWLKHLRACDAAGQTTNDYAKAHGINVKSMYSARKGLAERATLPRSQASRFQEDYAWGLCTLILPPFGYLYGLFRLDKAGQAILLAFIGVILIWLA